MTINHITHHLIASAFTLVFLTGCAGVETYESDKTKVAVPKADFYSGDVLFTPNMKMAISQSETGQVVVHLPSGLSVLLDETGCTTKNVAARVMRSNTMTIESKTLWGAYDFKPEVFCFELVGR